MENIREAIKQNKLNKLINNIETIYLNLWG
jgi:hypothetical protein